MSQYPWHADTAPEQRGLGIGIGCGLGGLVGLAGPIFLGLLAWGVNSVAAPQIGNQVVGATVVAMLFIPLPLFVLGCILLFPEFTRGVGVAALMASGVWLISGAGVCVVAFFGALASYEGAVL